MLGRVRTARVETHVDTLAAQWALVVPLAWVAGLWLLAIPRDHTASTPCAEAEQVLQHWRSAAILVQAVTDDVGVILVVNKIPCGRQVVTLHELDPLAVSWVEDVCDHIASD